MESKLEHTKRSLAYYYRNQQKRRKAALEYHEKIKQKDPVRYWANCSVHSHQQRGYDLQYTVDELAAFARDRQCCYYCGNKLKFKKHTNNWRHDLRFAPSIDNRDNTQTLTLENINLVCRACNVAKGFRTHDDFVEYCKNITSKFC